MRRLNLRPGGPAPGRLLAAVCLALVATGCGSDGTADVTLQPTPRSIVPAVTGTVFAPNGDFAAADTWWRWACPVGFLSPAYAQTCLMQLLPAGGTLNVALWQVDYLDAKDGDIDNPRLVNQARTDPEAPGLYEIIDSELEDLDQPCPRFMVVVGGNQTLTRAFVLEHTTNINAVTEAVVRMVLQRLTQAPPVQLCAFTNDGLANLLKEARDAACTARGDTVAEINQSAYERVANNCGVLQAINDATGVPVPLPRSASNSKEDLPAARRAAGADRRAQRGGGGLS